MIVIVMYLTRDLSYISTLLYSDISLFRKMEKPPINSEFHKFLLRTIMFFLTFHYCGINSYSNTLSLYFPTENTRADVFFSCKEYPKTIKR